MTPYNHGPPTHPWPSEPSLKSLLHHLGTCCINVHIQSCISLYDDIIRTGRLVYYTQSCTGHLKPIFHCDAKPFALDPGVGLDPQRHNFALEIPTCWYLKTRKFAFSPTPNLKVVLPPTRNPNASQWNKGCIGFKTQFLCVGHVHFMLFVSISFTLGSKRKRSFQWNMGFTIFRNPPGHFRIGADLSNLHS